MLTENGKLKTIFSIGGKMWEFSAKLAKNYRKISEKYRCRN
jgi:hypothetical protein